MAKKTSKKVVTTSKPKGKKTTTKTYTVKTDNAVLTGKQQVQIAKARAKAKTKIATAGQRQRTQQTVARSTAAATSVGSASNAVNESVKNERDALRQWNSLIGGNVQNDSSSSSSSPSSGKSDGTGSTTSDIYGGMYGG